MPRTLRTHARLVLAALVLAAASLAHPAAAHAQSPARGMRELAREVAMEYGSRASSAERDGHPIDAEALYYRALSADAGYLAGFLGYARLLAARGRTDEALQALAAVPQRAIEADHDAVQLARTRAQLGDVDGALELLGARSASVEAARARADVAAQAGRFPQALLAARRLADLVRGTDDARTAVVLVRALGILVGDADCVRVPGADAPRLRRWLAEQ